MTADLQATWKVSKSEESKAQRVEMRAQKWVVKCKKEWTI